MTWNFTVMDKLLLCVQNLFGEHQPIRPALILLRRTSSFVGAVLLLLMLFLRFKYDMHVQ